MCPIPGAEYCGCKSACLFCAMIKMFLNDDFKTFVHTITYLCRALRISFSFYLPVLRGCGYAFIAKF